MCGLVVWLKSRKLFGGIVLLIWIFEHAFYQLNLEVFGRAGVAFWTLASKLLHAWGLSQETSGVGSSRQFCF